ncbi:MAG: ABC transporter ATP-binding protein, partial [Clostridiales bacterium]|nr:ABC transporter ATP-binding protein [Clostridiales bacterium]
MNQKAEKEKTKKEFTTIQLMKRFFPYYGKYKGTLILDLICASLTTVCELALPMIMRYITNEGIYRLAQLTVMTIVRLGGLYFILRVIECLANYYMANMGHVMGTKIETDMRRDAYGHLQKLSNQYYNNTKVGQIMGRITNDLFDVTEFAHHCPEEFLIALIKGLVAFLILIRINMMLTLVVFVMIPIMIFVCTRINRKMRRVFGQQRHQIGELNARIEDSLLGQRVVKAFTNEEIENEKFEKDSQQFYRYKKESYKYMAAFQTSTRAFDGI